jgi:nicotinamidase-related amidase
MASAKRTVTLELPVPEPKPVTIDPAKTALVIVDMQNDFCKPEGLVYLSPRRGAVIEPIRRLVGRCRESGIEVIYVQSIRYPDSPEFTAFGRRPFLLQGSWGAQIADELTPLPDEPVVEKNSHDCFNNTRMEQLLAEKGIRPCEWTIIVVGLGLTNCVGCAVSGFSVRSYWVVLPMDCTAAASGEEEICQYQRFMQRGYDFNVTLTTSELIEIAARPLVGTRQA